MNPAPVRSTIHSERLLVDELKFDGIFAFELSPLTTLDACVEASTHFKGAQP